MNLLSIQYGLAFQGFQAGGILTGMDPKEISAFLAPPKMTVWEHLLAFIGAAIGLLLIAAGTSLYKHDYHCGVGCFLAALVLGFAFFRKRKLALVITSLAPSWRSAAWDSHSTQASQDLCCYSVALHHSISRCAGPMKSIRTFRTGTRTPSSMVKQPWLRRTHA